MNPHLNILLGSFNYSNENYEEAIEALNTSLNLGDPNHNQYLYLAESYRHLGDYETAILTYEKALLVNYPKDTLDQIQKNIDSLKNNIPY